jgi:hypothetical protein
MNRVRVKDLALVAAAGGLLAFELVSIGEALPNVKKAVAARGWSAERVEIAPASAEAMPLPAVEPPAAMVSPGPVVSPMAMASPVAARVAKRHACTVTVSTSSKACVAVARARDARRAGGRVRVVKVAVDGSCVVCAVAQAAEKRRDAEKTISLTSKSSTL